MSFDANCRELAQIFSVTFLIPRRKSPQKPVWVVAAACDRRCFPANMPFSALTERRYRTFAEVSLVYISHDNLVFVQCLICHGGTERESRSLCDICLREDPEICQSAARRSNLLGTPIGHTVIIHQILAVTPKITGALQSFADKIGNDEPVTSAPALYDRSL